MPAPISSPHNPRIKEIAKLAKRSHRDARGVTVVEGEREATLALNAGIVPLEVYICPPLLAAEGAGDLLARLRRLESARQVSLFEVTPEVFAKVAYREESGGLLLVIPYLSLDLDSLPIGTPAFLAVVEGIEKPGNLGAILRTADAAGVDGLVICDGATDIHNPNTIRASLGALFTVPVAEASTAEVIAWLRRRQIAILVATPTGDARYTEVDLTGPVALVLGSEAHGLSSPWLEAADHRVHIPMRGAADSLNLATSTALLLYEVIRQRNRATPASQPDSS